MKKDILFLLFLPFSLLIQSIEGQGHISFECRKLNISKSETLECDPISEDDPKDLAEAYGYLIAFFPQGYNGAGHRFELHFPTRTGVYHWVQSDIHDKNDSLEAGLYYDYKEHEFSAYPHDFTITVTRYDAVRGGIIEGKFEGTMEAFTAWDKSYVDLSVKGDFRTTRNGTGSEDRKQRSSEKPVIGKAVSVCDEALTHPLQNSEWKIEERTDGRSTNIANNPAPFVPMFCSPILNLKLIVDPYSNYGKMLKDSAEYYAAQSSQNSNDYKLINASVRNMARIANMQKLEISVAVNYPYLKQDHPMAKNDRFTLLHVPGASYACQIYNAPQNDLDPPDEMTRLFFGNWTGADMNAKTYKGFPFIHKTSFAAIENIVVTITGAASAANEIIKEINWNRLNEALN